ncbi:MAG: UbiA family prenyltransferase [Rhodobacteraceae bacterium]|nr:UbiA family prenyltransferase [Paracoccaceae bacterium]
MFSAAGYFRVESCKLGKNRVGSGSDFQYKVKSTNQNKALAVAQENQEIGDLPLVVDVDDSLLKTDLLMECFWAALGKHPLLCLMAVFTLFNNRALLKARLAQLASLDTALLPRRGAVQTLISGARGEVVLASGSDISLVESLSQQLGLEAAPMGSDGKTNLTGANKAKALVARYGAGQFTYVGDSVKDIPVWDVAAGGYCVAPSDKLASKLRAAGVKIEPIGEAAKPANLFRALRPRQWLKNILLFLPLLAAHRADFAGFTLAMWGVAIFSAAASSIYIVNDLMDLEADRKHETKCNRPFASGAVSILSGMGASVALALGALGGALLHSWQLGAIIALYMVLSLSYSLGLKRLRWVDIAMLASLYTLRVVAGSVAVGVAMSGWLGAFIFPVFLALGGVKRLIELGKTKSEAALPGRGYARRDREDLRNIAITASVGAIVVYLLYTYGAVASTLYQNLFEIRFAAIPVALWLGRMIYLGWHGRMDYDPIVFALRDPIGLTLIAVGGFMLTHAAS